MLASLLASTLALTPAFSEAPLLPVSGDTASLCVHATGAPGEVAIASASGARFLEATRTGFRPRGEVDLGGDGSCPETAARANGAGIAANVVDRRLLVAVRDPGGGWAAPQQLAGPDPLEDPWADPDAWDAEGVQVAVADSGDAVVAWTERRIADGMRRFRIARRAPGARFAPAAAIGRPHAREGGLYVGVAATGETVVVTANVEGRRPPLRMPLRAAIAPRHGAVPPLVGVAPSAWRSQPALAVAPDGRALLALSDGGSLVVAEREPGAAGFGAPVPVGRADDGTGVRTRAVLGPAGEAAVAWLGIEQEGAAVATRRGPGPFTPLVTVAPSAKLTGDPFYRSEAYAWSTDFSPFYGQGAERLVLTRDGRALFGRVRMADVEGVSRTSAVLAVLPLGGTQPQSGELGGVMGLAGAVTPIELADGTPAVAWGERLEGFGTIRLAAPGAEAPADPPPPVVEVGAPADRELRANERLVLPVRCSGPCELYAQVVNASRAYARLRLPRGGEGRLRFWIAGVPIAPRRLGPVRIRLTYGAPDAQRPPARTETVRLVRARERAAPPAPRVEGLRAVRREGTIRVSWRVRHPDDLALFFVTGAATRAWSGEPPAFASAFAGRVKRSFAVTLTPAAGVRWVTLRDVAQRTRAVVPVR